MQQVEPADVDATLVAELSCAVASSTRFFGQHRWPTVQQ